MNRMATRAALLLTVLWVLQRLRRAASWASALTRQLPSPVLVTVVERTPLDQLRQCHEAEQSAMKELAMTELGGNEGSPWQLIRRQFPKLWRASSLSASEQEEEYGEKEQIAALRRVHENSHHTSQAAQQALAKLLPTATPSSRAGYLRTLPAILGEKPARKWQEEWVELQQEHLGSSSSAGTTCNGGNTTGAKASIKAAQEEVVKKKKYIDDLIAAGWDRQHAEAFMLLATVPRPLAQALEKRDNQFAASTYALSEAVQYGIDLQRERHRNEGAQIRIAPKLYKNLYGDGGLESADPAWGDIERADHTGFQGLTSYMFVRASCRADNFTAEGFWGTNKRKERDAPKYVLIPSDVVCFESAPMDDVGHHEALMTAEDIGSFPPNTLYHLVRVEEAGQWEAPGGSFPRRRLLVVRASYLPSTSCSGGNAAESKMVSMPRTLHYASRDAYVQGLNDILSRPTLTLDQEFTRGKEWVDWKGAKHRLQDEWRYVNGPAQPSEMSAGRRDENNEGKLPEEFQQEVNDHIRQRRQQLAGRAQMLPEEHAYLTLDEVLAVRLYSGPSYQVINEYLRQIGHLTGEFRQHVAHDPGLTFSATVSHLCRAIRKLAAVSTEEEATAPLLRGVRGELPRTFWTPDEHGRICAVDMAFMSTSLSRSTPISYLGDGDNVLWELEPQLQSDVAFHRGADISLLSQFAKEREVVSR